MGIRRATKHDPCPVCGGHPDMQRGQGMRCTGFTTDGGWIHCTREEFAGSCKRHDSAVEPTWSHKGEGPCPCGKEHAPGAYEPPPNRSDGLRNRASNERPKQQQGGEVRQIGESKRAEIVETYDYRDRVGRLLYQVCRMHPKSFRQRRPDPDNPGKWLWTVKGLQRTLYQIPELVSGLSAGDTVWIVEGEKDVHAMEAAHQVATCNTGGAGAWDDKLAGIFEKFGLDGSEIRIIQDLDPEFKPNGQPHREGQRHARAVYESIAARVGERMKVSIWEAAVGKDAGDHLEAGKGVEDFVQIYPFPDDLLQTDPQRFKQHQIRQALDAPAKVLETISRNHTPEQQPLVPTGLVGSSKLSHLQGVTVLAGEPSAGKSYFAISTAIAAANAGWEVFYLSCEMHEDIVFNRAVRALAGSDLKKWDWRDQQAKNDAVRRARTLQIPENLAVVNVDAGVTINAVVELLALAVTHKNTLVIMDSLSSFVDNLEEDDARGDPFKMAALRQVVRLATATRRLTHGHVAWLLLSELNKEGKAKGRFIEHRSDIGLAMKSDPEQNHLKSITVTKSWWGPGGPMGEFVLEHDLAHLVKPSPDPEPQPVYDGDGQDDSLL